MWKFVSQHRSFRSIITSKFSKIEFRRLSEIGLQWGQYLDTWELLTNVLFLWQRTEANHFILIFIYLGTVVPSVHESCFSGGRGPLVDQARGGIVKIGENSPEYVNLVSYSLFMWIYSVSQKSTSVWKINKTWLHDRSLSFSFRLIAFSPHVKLWSENFPQCTLLIAWQRHSITLANGLIS